MSQKERNRGKNGQRPTSSVAEMKLEAYVQESRGGQKENRKMTDCCSCGRDTAGHWNMVSTAGGNAVERMLMGDVEVEVEVESRSRGGGDRWWLLKDGEVGGGVVVVVEKEPLACARLRYELSVSLNSEECTFHSTLHNCNYAARNPEKDTMTV